MPSSYRAEIPYSELLVSHNPSSRICSRTYKLGPNFAEFLKNSTAGRFEERAGPVRAMMARSFDLDDASREEHTASRHRDDAELPSFDFTQNTARLRYVPPQIREKLHKLPSTR